MKPEFRRATLRDTPLILELVREFYATQGGIYGIPFDSVQSTLSIRRVIQEGICIVGPSSCAGAFVSGFPWGRASVAHVMFWYFRESREIAIFKAILTACKAAGATHAFAASHPPHHRIDRLYAKIGLHRAELLSMVAL